MISLTIVGLILVIVLGSLRVGIRAWEKGEKDTDAHQRQRIVLDLMKRQMASARPLEVTIGEETPFMLKGDDRSLEFVSGYPMVSLNRSGLVLVRYVVEEDAEGRERLSFSEKGMAFIGGKKKRGTRRKGDQDAVDLIPDSERVRFAYLKRAEDDKSFPTWQDAWDPSRDEGLPLAVEITFKESENTPPIRVIARMEAEG
jgi:hypothetical protein